MDYNRAEPTFSLRQFRLTKWSFFVQSTMHNAPSFMYTWGFIWFLNYADGLVCDCGIPWLYPLCVVLFVVFVCCFFVCLFFVVVFSNCQSLIIICLERYVDEQNAYAWTINNIESDWSTCIQYWKSYSINNYKEILHKHIMQGSWVGSRPGDWSQNNF